MVKGSSNSNELQSAIDRSFDSQSIDTSAFPMRISLRTPTWCPPADMYENETAIVVRVEIAGMKENDFSIELNGRNLAIKGSRQDVAEKRAFHQMEIRFGEFSIDLELPLHVDIDQIQATYSNGFLKIVLPKALPRHISVSE